MTNLTNQDALQPYFEYIPPTPIGVIRKYGKKCPLCDSLMDYVSTTCGRCRFLKNRSPIDENIYIVEGDKCRKIPLNNGFYSIVNAELYEYLMQWRWRAYRYSPHKSPHVVTDSLLDSPIGKQRHKTVRMHHVIMKAPSFVMFDHKNLDTFDNRRSNLRKCNNRQNVQNRGLPRNNTSGYKGVTKQTHYDAWVSIIGVDGKRINLGTYPTPLEAAIVRDFAALKYHGEFACLNFPREIYLKVTTDGADGVPNDLEKISGSLLSAICESR